MMFAKCESIIFALVSITFRGIPSGPLVLFWSNDFIVRFISAVLAFGKSNRSVF